MSTYERDMSNCTATHFGLPRCIGECLDPHDCSGTPVDPRECDACDGSGTIYTHPDETEVGQAPGSSAQPCPVCNKPGAGSGFRTQSQRRDGATPDEPDPRGRTVGSIPATGAIPPRFLTQWEREDYERQQRGEPPLGPFGTGLDQRNFSIQAAEIRRLREKIETLELENWQLKGALGYPVPADVPPGTFRCGMCAARAFEARAAAVERRDWKAAAYQVPPRIGAREALACVIDHWDEFGPEHGFDEAVDRARPYACGTDRE